jgi:hypothetical protein
VLRTVSGGLESLPGVQAYHGEHRLGYDLGAYEGKERTWQVMSLRKLIVIGC